MVFKNRKHAALLLAKKLIHYKGINPLVLGIPNGGIPIAKKIAEILRGELDAVLIEKISPPGEGNITLGAVDETGKVYVSTLANNVGLSEEIITREKKQKDIILLKKRKQFKKKFHPFKRTVIIVDDGTATNIAMIAALRLVRNNKPKHLVAATIMTPKESLDVIQELADDVVSLTAPKNPYSVSDFFIHLNNISDEEAIEIIQKSHMASGKHK